MYKTPRGILPNAAVIPNDHGRVVDPTVNHAITGEYAVGWIKRGPTGIIGTNKPDSQETADLMLADLAAGETFGPQVPAVVAVLDLGAELFERHEVPVDLTPADVVATQGRDQRLARPMQQRATEQDRDAATARELAQPLR